MELNVDEKALFEPYLCKDDLHPTLKEPFVKDGYVCATDACSILRIRQDLLKGEYSEKPHTPPISKVLTSPNFDKVLTLARIEKAIAQCPLEDEMELESPEISCSECNGTGEVIWEYTDRNHYIYAECYNCPICNGVGIFRAAKYRKTGRKVLKYEADIDVYGIIFRAGMLQRLCDTMKTLGINEARYVARHKSRHNVFNLADGIDVGLMDAIRPEAEAKYE